MFDVFLLVSKKEGMPRSILEAMAVKTAVLSFAVDGINDMIIDNVSGFLIDPFDYQALKNKIESILINGISESIPEIAHNLLIKRFEITQVNKKILNTLTNYAKKNN